MYGCGEPFLAALLGCAAWVAGNEICLSVWSDLQRVVRTVSSSSPSSKTMPIDPGLSKLTSTGSSSSSDEDSAGAGSAASSSSSNARSTTGGYATPGTPRHGHACTSGPSNMLDIHGAFAVQNPNEGCGRVCQWVCMGPEPIWPGAIEIPIRILNCTHARTMYSNELQTAVHWTFMVPLRCRSSSKRSRKAELAPDETVNCLISPLHYH